MVRLASRKYGDSGSEAAPTQDGSLHQYPSRSRTSPARKVRGKCSENTPIGAAETHVLNDGLKVGLSSLSSHSSKDRDVDRKRSPRKRVVEDGTQRRGGTLNTTQSTQTTSTDSLTTSSSSQQRQTGQITLKPAPINSLLLPFNGLKLEDESRTDISGFKNKSFSLQPKPSSAISPQKENARRSSPVRKAKQAPKYSYKWYESDSDETDEFTDLSGFIVEDDTELSCHGSNSESDVASRRQAAPKSQRRLVRGRDLKKSQRKIANEVANLTLQLNTIDLTESPKKEESNSLFRSPAVISDDIFGVPDERKSDANTQQPKRQFDLFETEPKAILKFSPPRLKSPFKIPTKENFPREERKVSAAPVGTGFTTPPASPSKPKLNSPSKARARQIPMSPHRPSIDAFWSADVINDWNDNYSPPKPPMTSPRKNGLSKFLIFSEDEEESSSSTISTPTTSPRRREKVNRDPIDSQLSPTKLKKALQEEKKAAKAAQAAFESTKHDLATSFLKALDERITSGKLSSLAASTGGVKIIWSNTLRSTAGRANWRRTVEKLEQPAGSTSTVARSEVHHTATIELATKILTSRLRLLDTLAHEFCHLANFMISNIKDQPHGPSFKSWAAKVSAAFSNDPVYGSITVTTKHDYVIDWKYVWVCGGETAKSLLVTSERANGCKGIWEALVKRLADPDDEDGVGCGTEYGRHSKSIDPLKHRCGKCKGGLVQVKPKPRAVAVTAAATSGRTRSGAGGTTTKTGKKNNNKKKKKGDSDSNTTDSIPGGQIDIAAIVKDVEVLELSD